MNGLWHLMTHGGFLCLTVLLVIATEVIAWRRQTRIDKSYADAADAIYARYRLDTSPPSNLSTTEGES